VGVAVLPLIHLLRSGVGSAPRRRESSVEEEPECKIMTQLRRA
jgi:hypothetical protein